MMQNTKVRIENGSSLGFFCRCGLREQYLVDEMKPVKPLLLLTHATKTRRHTTSNCTSCVASAWGVDSIPSARPHVNHMG